MENKITLKMFVFIVFLLGLPFITQAGYVNGYFKNNGTYVPGYYRSNPNAYKYNNHSFEGGDLFNASYYYPTKNYSDGWYSPSYVTKSNYNISSANIYPQTNRSYELYSPSLYNTYQIPTYNFYQTHPSRVSNMNNYILGEAINYSRSVLGR